MKIIHYGLSVNKGGIETYLYKLYSHINKSKYHFDFIDTNNEKICYFDEFREMGCNFFKITPRKNSFMKNKRDLDTLFKYGNFDILHCHLNTLSYVEPIYAALRHNCKVIVHSRSAGIPQSFVTKILHNINYYALPRKKIKMLAVSDDAGEWLYGRKTNFTTINNGVDISRFKFNEIERIKTRREMKQEDRYVVGHVGSLSYPKNHIFLLRVFKNVVKIKPNAVLWLVGSGRLEGEIRQKIKDLGLQDQVYFMGNRPDISSLLSAMDVFLFPSLYEGFPNAVLEAQTSGLPCLISDMITNEIVITDNCVRLSLTFPADQWAKELIGSTVYQERKKGAYLVNKAGFSVEEEICKIEKIYLEVGVKSWKED